MTSTLPTRLLDSLPRLTLLLGGAYTLAQASLYDVQGGHRAVVFDRFRGVDMKKVRGEGMHAIIPGIQKAVIFDTRTKSRNISTNTGSKDMQMVTLTLRVLHKPNIDKLPIIYQTLGQDYDERVLPSIGNEVLKAIVAQFDASELITQRELVSQRIRTDLIKRAAEFNILFDDVSITHLAFGADFTAAVEQKQIAQQEVERAKFVVEKAEKERQANVVRAEGESQAAQLISKALQASGTGLIELRRIEASKDIAGILSQSPNITYLPGGPGGEKMLLNVK